MIEDVNGIVIGATSWRVGLFVNDKEIAWTHAYSFEEGLNWAKKVRQSRLTEIGSAEATRLGWDKPWEMRYYD